MTLHLNVFKHQLMLMLREVNIQIYLSAEVSVAEEGAIPATLAPRYTTITKKKYVCSKRYLASSTALMEV